MKLRPRPWTMLSWFVATTGAFAAVDISGTYADKGTQVTAEGDGPVVVSFHGILALEFAPHVHEADYAATTHLVLVDRDGKLDIEIFDEAGTMIWGAVWDAHEGFSHEGESAVIRVQQKNKPDERVSFVMTPQHEGQLLEVKVYHVKSSAVGPYSELIGTYLFGAAE